MAVGCVHGRAMPLCGVGATGRVHAMNFGTWMIMNDTADASTHLAMKRRHGDRRRLLARDSNHGKGQRPGSSPGGCRREPPCQPPRGKPSAQRRTTTTTHHHAPAPPRSTPWRPACPRHRAERHGAQRQRKTQPPPTPTATSNRHHNPHHSPHRHSNATHEQTTRANSNHHPQANYLSQET